MAKIAICSVRTAVSQVTLYCSFDTAATPQKSLVVDGGHLLQVCGVCTCYVYWMSCYVYALLCVLITVSAALAEVQSFE